MRKLLPWLALLIAALWIYNDPSGAAANIRHAFDGLAAFAHGL